ncbi:MAG: VanZ family protein [Defluviitaleaceae bacterium]|nr:VanZ family protein [Defluviitaleaceae bacterium]
MFSITLLFFRGSPYNPIEVDPIASYRRALAAPSHLAVVEVRGIVINIVMFMPLGFLLPFVWHPLRKFYLTMPILFLSTFFIEIVQLLTFRGVFAVEDIMHNLVGGVIGFVVFYISSSYSTKLSS